MTKRLGQLVDWFVAPSVGDATSERYYRARLTVIFSLVGAVVGIVFAAVYLWWIAHPTGALMLGTAGLVAGTLPFILRRTGAVRLAAHLLVFCLFGAATFTGYLRGGFPATAIVWYVLVPIVALQMVSIRAAWVWAGVCMAAAGVFYALYRFGTVLPSRVVATQERLADLDVLGLVGLIFLCACLGYLYERAKAGLLAERAKLEELSQKSMRLESLGQMAGGICHDFNNLLAVVIAHAELILGDLKEHDPLYDDVLSIRKAGQRGADLTRQLLAFSHQGEAQATEVIDVNGVVTEVQSLLRRTISGSIEVVTSLGADVGRVKMAKSQLEQVVINLALNARDAMPEGGRLTIETRAVTTDDVKGAATEDRHEARAQYVELRVCDTGSGMDEETQAHVFEPFFTTKSRTSGTGLGLATVYGIVAQAGGTTNFSSVPGAGTTFTILLPMTEEEAGESTESPRGVGSCGPYRILLVDDEQGVVNAVGRILERHGYELLRAHDGHEALAIYEAHTEPIDLLLTDVVMPGMSGIELAKRVSSVHPGTSVLFISGYPPDSHQGFQGDRVPEPLLRKPFSADELLRQVQELLPPDPNAAMRLPA